MSFLTCCGSQPGAIVTDDVSVPAVAAAEQKPDTTAPPQEAPKAAEPKAEPKPDASSLTTATRFTAALTRATPQTPWGVDLTSDSDHSLTIVRIAPDGAFGMYNQKKLNPLKSGDVIVAVNGAKTKADMVGKLKSEINVQAQIVRYGLFEAVLKKNATAEPLSMDVNDAGPNVLLIQKISPVSSAITRYNEQNFEKPIIEGDQLIAVNGKETVGDMVKEMQAGTTLTCKVKRAWA